MNHFANNFNPTFQNHHGNKSTHAEQSKTYWLRITLWLKSPPHHLLNKGRMENQQQELGWFKKTKNDVEMLKGLLTSTKGLEKKLDFIFENSCTYNAPQSKDPWGFRRDGSSERGQEDLVDIGWMKWFHHIWLLLRRLGLWQARNK